MSTGGDDLELDYAALVDMIADVVYAIDLRGCFIYVNTAGEDVFGWRAQDLMGEHMTAVLAPDSVAATVEHFRRGVMDPARTPYFETTILRPDGTTPRVGDPRRCLCTGTAARSPDRVSAATSPS